MEPTHRTRCQRCYDLALSNCNVLDVKTDGQSMAQCNHCAYNNRSCTLLRQSEGPPLRPTTAQQRSLQTKAQQEPPHTSPAQQEPQSDEPEVQPSRQNETQQQRSQPLAFQQAHLPPQPYMAHLKQPQLSYGVGQEQHDFEFAASDDEGTLVAQAGMKRGFGQIQVPQSANNDQGQRGYDSVHTAKRRQRQEQIQSSMLRNSKYIIEPSSQESASRSSQDYEVQDFDGPGRWSSRRDWSQSPPASNRRNTGNFRQLLTPLEAETQPQIAVERALYEHNERVFPRDRALEQQYRERLQQADLRWRVNGQQFNAPADNNALREQLTEAKRQIVRLTHERDAARESNNRLRQHILDFFAKIPADIALHGTLQNLVDTNQSASAGAIVPPFAPKDHLMYSPAAMGGYGQSSAPMGQHPQPPEMMEQRIQESTREGQPAAQRGRVIPEWSQDEFGPAPFVSLEPSSRAEALQSRQTEVTSPPSETTRLPAIETPASTKMPVGDSSAVSAWQPATMARRVTAGAIPADNNWQRDVPSRAAQRDTATGTPAGGINWTRNVLEAYLKQDPFQDSGLFEAHNAAPSKAALEREQTMEKHGFTACCSSCWARGMKCDKGPQCERCLRSNTKCEWLFCDDGNCKRQACYKLHHWSDDSALMRKKSLATALFLALADKNGVEVQVTAHWPRHSEALPHSEKHKNGFIGEMPRRLAQRWQPAIYFEQEGRKSGDDAGKELSRRMLIQRLAEPQNLPARQPNNQALMRGEKLKEPFWVDSVATELATPQTQSMTGLSRQQNSILDSREDSSHSHGHI